MNDDTVPDVGMTIGFEGTKVSLHCWRKCLLPAFALAAFCANAEVEMIGSIEWKYSVDDNGKAMIVSALDYAPKHPSEISGSVTIPSTLGGCPVVGIGRRAFYSCDNLVSVAIPEGVETIGDEAFCGCGKLSSVSIPDSVKTIDVDAFLECSSSLYDQSVKKEVRIVDGWVVGRGFSQTNALPSLRTAIQSHAASEFLETELSSTVSVLIIRELRMQLSISRRCVQRL